MSLPTIPEKMTRAEAIAAGYRSLTTGYNLPHEQWMLDNVLADTRRGGIDVVLVDSIAGPEVWRRAPRSNPEDRSL